MFTPEQERILRKPKYILGQVAFDILFDVHFGFTSWLIKQAKITSINGNASAWDIEEACRDNEHEKNLQKAFLASGYKRISSNERKELKTIFEEVKRRRDILNEWIDSMEKKFRFSSPDVEAVTKGNVVKINFRR